jgi:hypothetical protein
VRLPVQLVAVARVVVQPVLKQLELPQRHPQAEEAVAAVVAAAVAQPRLRAALLLVQPEHKPAVVLAEAEALAVAAAVVSAAGQLAKARLALTA